MTNSESSLARVMVCSGIGMYGELFGSIGRSTPIIDSLINGAGIGAIGATVYDLQELTNSILQRKSVNEKVSDLTGWVVAGTGGVILYQICEQGSYGILMISILANALYQDSLKEKSEAN